MSAPTPIDALRAGPAPPRIRIEVPHPAVDGGFAVKCTAGDRVEVSADIVRDGHEVLRAAVRARPDRAGAEWREWPLTHIDAHLRGDRWAGAFDVDDRIGPWVWTIVAWLDPFSAWREEVRRKADAGQTDLDGELSEGAQWLRKAADRPEARHAQALRAAAAIVADTARPTPERVDAGLHPELHAFMLTDQDRFEVAALEPHQPLWVDRERARFSSWYELFPRSWGGFQGVTEQIPKLAALGFDVLYMPPIHPIGITNRKGKNNTLVADEDDVGVPYAVGLKGVGGHEAVHPDLGTFADFEALVAKAQEHDMDVCLDIALNASADHPWLTEHPEWFQQRPDGTLKYAENPPKKYQDIYNFDWGTEHWRELWQAWYEVLDGWVHRGVTAFRIDNPHTKPFPFWEWLIEEIHRDHPEVIFLAEAFTKRKVMQQLGKLGFTQSYTYFTWKTAKWELEEYLSELAHGPERHYFRPNFFPNTPDILEAYLVDGGPAAFYVRFVLATTLSPSYGIYSGFEHYENVPLKPGSEEYLDSEKYELKSRRLDGPMLPFVQRINEIRHAHPALQRLENLRFLETENERVIAYAKRWGEDIVIVACTLDPHGIQEAVVNVPADLGLAPVFGLEDLLSGERFDWHLGRNYVRLDPDFRVAHILTVRPS